MHSPIKPADFRDSASGQYAHRDMGALCVCGHPLAIHAAVTEGGQRPCFNGDGPGLAGATGEPCNCEKFRKSRKR